MGESEEAAQRAAEEQGERPSPSLSSFSLEGVAAGAHKAWDTVVRAAS
jgi:hypothetical protein